MSKETEKIAAGDRRYASNGSGSVRRPKQSSNASTFAVGLVLVLGAAWYYFYANTASQTLAERDFRQLNQLADHANSVLSNFRYLFQFSLLQELSDSVDLEPEARDACAIDGNNDTGGLIEFLRCRYEKSANGAAILNEGAGAPKLSIAISHANAIREKNAKALKDYYESLRHSKLLNRVRLDVLPLGSTACTNTGTANVGETPHDDVMYRLDGPPGNKVLAIIDCRKPGGGAVDIRKQLVARIPFSDIFAPSAVDLDFDQIGVVDENNEVLFLSTERINRRHRKVGRMVDTSAFARIAALDIGNTKAAKDAETGTAVRQHSTTILERKLGNISYKVFVQPHVPSLAPIDDQQSARWSIIGLKQTKRFNAERFPLPAYQFGIFTFALILSVALLPTIRLLFLGQGTSLSRLDFSILIFSLLIATGAAAIMGLMVDTGLKMHGDQKVRLEKTARDVKQHLKAEIGRKYIALEAIEAKIIDKYKPPPNLFKQFINTNDNDGAGDRGRLFNRLLSNVPRYRALGAENRLSAANIRALKFWADTGPLYKRIVALIKGDDALTNDLGEVLAAHKVANDLSKPLNNIPLKNFDPQCWNEPRALAKQDRSGQRQLSKTYALQVEPFAVNAPHPVGTPSENVSLDGVASRALGRKASAGRAGASYGALVGTTTKKTNKERAPPTSGDKNPGPISPLNFDLAWLIDDSGNQVASQSYFRRQAVRFISVPNRQYFLRAKQDRVWHPRWLDKDRQKGVFIERVFSRAEGSRLTIIAKPVSRDSLEGKSIADCGPRVAAITTRMDSLANPVLPAGYGFAVIDDADGTVLYHSDDNRSLIENFYTETSNNKSLLAATQLDEPDHFSADYSGRTVQAYVSAIPQMPWSLVVYSDHELNATMNLLSAFYAFALVVAIGMIVLIAMETIHWFGKPISKSWWPHRTNIRSHALVLVISVAYLAGLLAALREPNSKWIVVTAVLLGPYLIAAFSWLWDPRYTNRVLLSTAIPIALLWWLSMDIVEFIGMAIVIGGSIYLALQRVAETSRAANHFRTVHALAGVVLLAAVVGVPAIVFYHDALTYHLYQEQSLKDASISRDERRRRVAQESYDRILAEPVVRYPKETECLGVYTPCEERGEALPEPPKLVDLFASKTAQFSAAWYSPRAAETAMLRPRSGGSSTQRSGDALSAAIYVDRSIVALILCVLALFLYAIARVASLRLFGLQGGDAHHYLDHFACDLKRDGPRPNVEDLRAASLLIGYSPSGTDLDHWKRRYIVAPVDRAKEIVADGRTVILYGLESALRERDPERSREYREEITRIQAQGRRIVLCSEVLPSYWLSHAVDDERAEISGGVRGRKKWLQLLSGFYWYAPPQTHHVNDQVEAETDTTMSAHAHDIDPSPEQILREELAAFPELGGYYEMLETRVQGLRRHQILPLVFHAAHAVYARKWHACTLTEQAILLQIAHRELVNPEQYEVIGSLEVRGLIRRDPRIRMTNQTFLWFVENASISAELANHSAQYERNLWQSMRWPVIIVLALSALFLFQIGGEKIELAVGGLGSLVALTTVARQLLSQLRGGAKP